MQTIDYLHIITTVTFAIAAFYKLRGSQQEHFYTRLIAAAWFGLTVLDRDIPVVIVRIINNCVIIAIPTTEILAPAFMRFWKNKK